MVIQNVLPLLQGGECRMTEAELAVRLKEWFEGLGCKEVIFRSDCPGLDWPWVEQLFQIYGCWPKNLRQKSGQSDLIAASSSDSTRDSRTTGKPTSPDSTMLW